MPVSSGIMAVDEQKLRRSLHDRLESARGADEAALLMDYLPPVGWADVARKEDLDHLAAVTKKDLDAAIKSLEVRLLKWIGPTVVGAIGVAVTLAALSTALVT